VDVVVEGIGTLSNIVVGEEGLEEKR
jgi:hypothetical protein